jgi:hypothetical protein
MPEAVTGPNAQPQKKLSRKSYCATDASAWGHVALFYFGKKPPIGVESQLSCTARGQPKVSHSFRSVDDLPVSLQFLVSCGFLPDLERVKRLCPMVDVNTLRLPGTEFAFLGIVHLTARPIIRNPANMKLLTLLRSFTPASSIVTVG